MIYALKKKGLTVQDLFEELKIAVDEGYGKRVLMIGPLVNAVPASEHPITAGQRIYGVEANDDYEQGIFWLYPNEPEM